MYCKNCNVEIEGNNEYCDACKKYENSSKAPGIVAMALGASSLVGITGIIGAIAAIIIANMSRGTKGEEFGRIGKTCGIIGLILNGLAAIFALLVWIFVMAFYVIVLIIPFIMQYLS